MQLTKILTTTTPSTKVAGKPGQIKFLKMLGQLLDQSFSMKEALNFLQIVLGPAHPFVSSIKDQVSQGYSLDGGLRSFGFPAWICFQIYFAHQHGQLAHVLIQCAKQMQVEEERKKELLSLLSYPLFLLFFMLAMLMALRFILLPQFQSMVNSDDRLAQLAVQFIYYSPQQIFILCLLSVLFYFFIKRYQQKKSALELASLLSRIPILNTYVKKFYTYRFTKEWSALLASGLSMQELVMIMKQKESSALMQDIGQHLDRALLEGNNMASIMKEFHFFNPEFADLVLHGQKIANLDDSLAVYSNQCLEELDQAVKKAFAFIQPLLFLLIAFLLVVIYASMLIPMFSFMDTL